MRSRILQKVCDLSAILSVEYLLQSYGIYSSLFSRIESEREKCSTCGNDEMRSKSPTHVRIHSLNILNAQHACIFVDITINTLSIDNKHKA